MVSQRGVLSGDSRAIRAWTSGRAEWLKSVDLMAVPDVSTSRNRRSDRVSTAQRGVLRGAVKRTRYSSALPLAVAAPTSDRSTAREGAASSAGGKLRPVQATPNDGGQPLLGVIR